MARKDTNQRTVKTAETVVDIIETLSELEQASLTMLADALNMPRSTLHAYLSTLVQCEILVKEGCEYRLGTKFFSHGAQVRRMNPMYQESKQFLQQIADQTQEIAWLVVEEYGQGVCLRKVKGEFAVQPYKELGSRISLHNTAAGKAILSRLPPERTREIVDRYGLPKETKHTITNSDTLFEELETVREDGVAFNDEESMLGFRAVASPVSAPDGQTAALVASGPKNRLQGEKFSKTVPGIVSGAANALELKLSASST